MLSRPPVHASRKNGVVAPCSALAEHATKLTVLFELILLLPSLGGHEADDGVDKTVTILSQLATWSNQTGILLARMSIDGFDICVALCCGCEARTGTSRNSTARTNQEFERYANVEILEFMHVYIVSCQTERGSDEGHEFVQVDDFPGRQD